MLAISKDNAARRYPNTWSDNNVSCKRKTTEVRVAFKSFLENMYKNILLKPAAA